MEFKWLQGEGLQILDSTIEKMGWTPIPPSSLAYAAFDEGELAGFHILQLRPHPEPLWVAEKYRGSRLAVELSDSMNDFLKITRTKGFIVIADTPEAIKMCENNGMKKVTSPVYVR